MKIFITGIAGFIGGHLAKFFLTKGYEVFGVDLTPKHQLDLKYISHYEQMILPDDNVSNILRSYKPDICIHCAGGASVVESIKHPELDFNNTVTTTFNVLNSIKVNCPDCKTVFLSSAAVYGNPPNLPIKEDSCLKPISPYGFHKMIAEEICTEFFNLYNLNISIARIFSVYGPGLKKQLFWELYQKIQNSNKLECFGTGQESRDFIYINDLVRAIELIILNDDFNCDIYNIASGKEIAINYIVNNFVETINRNIKIVFNNEIKPGDPLNWLADISKLKALGFNSEYTINQGILEYIKWVKNA